MARTALSWNRSPEACLLLSSFPPVRSRCHPSLGLRQRYNSSDLGAWQPTPSHGPLIRHTFLRVEPSHGLGPVPILTDDHEMDRKKQKLESHIRTLKGLPSMSSRFFRKWMSSLPRGRKPSYLRESCVRRRTWANLFFFYACSFSRLKLLLSVIYCDGGERGALLQCNDDCMSRGTLVNNWVERCWVLLNWIHQVGNTLAQDLDQTTIEVLVYCSYPLNKTWNKLIRKRLLGKKEILGWAIHTPKATNQILNNI